MHNDKADDVQQSRYSEAAKFGFEAVKLQSY